MANHTDDNVHDAVAILKSAKDIAEDQLASREQPIVSRAVA